VLVKSELSYREYLGQGLAFPLQISQQGGIALASGTNDIEQAIRIILGTMPGERVMRPEFGCRIHELMFAPNNANTHGLAAYYVQKALEQWEPRIDVTDVSVRMEPGLDGALLIAIQYRPKDSHDERSIVYPFYLAGEAEPL
jgi:phage baseplate assembly protein W